MELANLSSTRTVRIDFGNILSTTVVRESLKSLELGDSEGLRRAAGARLNRAQSKKQPEALPEALWLGSEEDIIRKSPELALEPMVLGTAGAPHQQRR